MAKNEIFIVPEINRKEFKNLVRRANRRLFSAFDYIREKGITSDPAIRSLAHDYAYHVSYNEESKEYTSKNDAWISEKTPFSSSIKFANEKQYQQYVRHLGKWGNVENVDTMVKGIKRGYYKSMVQAMTQVAMEAGGILDEKGHLPEEITRRLRALTLEQRANFFDHADPRDHVEKNGFSSNDFNTADPDEFMETFDGLIKKLRQLYPEKRKPRKDKGKKRKRKKK